MKTSMSAPAVHKQYDEGVAAFRKLIADPALRGTFAREIDGFMRRSAAGVWGEDGGLSPRHVEYYNAIYCKGNSVPSTLYWELCSQVADYPGFAPPAFFEGLIKYDKLTHRQLSRRFIDTFTLMLLLFAAVDNVVSEREARFVNACADALSALCDAAGIPADKAALNIDEFITPGHATGAEPPENVQSQSTTPPAQASADSEPPATPEPTLEELLAELDSLCGLEKVKADV